MMNDTERPIGERVTAVETDIKHVLDGIVRIEGSVARIENVVIKEKTEKLEADIARIENVVIKDAVSRLETRIAGVESRIAETKQEFQQGVQILLAATSHNKAALYVVCGTVIAGIVAALLKGSFL